MVRFQFVEHLPCEVIKFLEKKQQVFVGHALREYFEPVDIKNIYEIAAASFDLKFYDTGLAMTAF